MKKIRLGITGHTGKMGQAILAEVKNFPEFIVDASLIEERDLNTLCKLSDVVIDFSAPALLRDLINEALLHNLPVVSGTTSLEAADFEALEQAAKTIPVLYSQNMSLGISIIGKIVRELYLKLGSMSDIEIVDIHHRNKKDAPSGTALLLASQMLNKEDIKPDIIQTKLFENSIRPKGKIGISSLRGGTVPGQHDVHFMMENESITITHQAFNRNIFAIGALKAALWLSEQKPGLYSMQDVLK